MQEILSSNPPVVTGIYGANKNSIPILLATRSKKKKTSKAIKFAKFTGHHETSFLVFLLSDRLCKTKIFSVNFYWTFYFLLDFTPLNP